MHRADRVVERVDLDREVVEAESGGALPIRGRRSAGERLEQLDLRPL
jgi:hypothetical protein